MNDTENPPDESPLNKRPVISAKFAIGAIVLCVAGYFGITWGMTQYMLWEEQNRDYTELVTEEDENPYGGGGDEQGGGGRRGGGRGGQGGGGGRGGDPEAFFARLDADENGVIEGEEISDRMADRVEQIDTDGDGKISKDEFLAGMANRRRGGDGGGRPGGGGRPDGDRPEGDLPDAGNANDSGERPQRPTSESDPSESEEADQKKEESASETPDSVSGQ